MNETDEYGYTGLHMAAENGHMEIVNILLVIVGESIERKKGGGRGENGREMEGGGSKRGQEGIASEVRDYTLTMRIMRWGDNCDYENTDHA